MTNATETARAAEGRLEELSREVVTTNASVVGEVFGHRLIGVSGFLFGREMTISALNLDVLLLIVRKASAPGSVLDLLNREQSLVVCERGINQNAEGDRCQGTNHKELKIEN